MPRRCSDEWRREHLRPACVEHAQPESRSSWTASRTASPNSWARIERPGAVLDNGRVCWNPRGEAACYAASAPGIAASRGRSRGGNSRLHASAATPSSARRASVLAPRMMYSLTSITEIAAPTSRQSGPCPPAVEIVIVHTTLYFAPLDLFPLSPRSRPPGSAAGCSPHPSRWTDRRGHTPRDDPRARRVRARSSAGPSGPPAYNASRTRGSACGLTYQIRAAGG